MNTLVPASIDELSGMLREASAARRSLIPVGGRTALHFIPSPAAAASLLSLKEMDVRLDHVAGDLVATLPAGVSLAGANETLAREGQCLPLDPPQPERATIGGIVGANDSGPRRHRYGAPRDLIIGINVVLADGRVVKAGGRVVKNVAGYDLSRLMCGSFGSLAVITSATFKLSPLAPFSRTVVAHVRAANRFADLLQALVNAPITPSTIELTAPPLRLLIRFETTRTAADQMAAVASKVCEAHGASAAIVSDAEERDAWAAAVGMIPSDTGTTIKLAVLPTDVPYLLGEIEKGCDAQHVSWRAAGRAALGVLLVHLDGAASDIASLIADWRQRATVHGGSLVIQRAAPGLDRVSRWGDPLPAMSMMRAVKARFDPHGILSPGMGPGGL